MTAMRRFVLRPCWQVQLIWIGADPLFRGYAITILCSIGMAAALGLGNEARFANPAWTLVQTTGGPKVWALTFLAIVAALVVTPRISACTTRWALQAAGALYLVWGIHFGYVAALYGASTYIGPVIYSAVALWHLSQAESYRLKLS